MITYKIEFEELPSGTMCITMVSPPALNTTIKEQRVALAWRDHNKSILEAFRKEQGGRWEIQN